MNKIKEGANGCTDESGASTQRTMLAAITPFLLAAITPFLLAAITPFLLTATTPFLLAVTLSEATATTHLITWTPGGLANYTAGIPLTVNIRDFVAIQCPDGLTDIFIVTELVQYRTCTCDIQEFRCHDKPIVDPCLSVYNNIAILDQPSQLGAVFQFEAGVTYYLISVPVNQRSGNCNETGLRMSMRVAMSDLTTSTENLAVSTVGYSLTMSTSTPTSTLTADSTEDNTAKSCPSGEYLSPANNTCLACPANTRIDEVGVATCPCLDSYYRAPGEDGDFACTQPPGVPTDVVVHRDGTEMFVSWTAPVNMGGRNDTFYRIWYGTQGGQIMISEKFTTTMANLMGLLPYIKYYVYVSAENGVSEVASSISAMVLENFLEYWSGHGLIGLPSFAVPDTSQATSQPSQDSPHVVVYGVLSTIIVLLAIALVVVLSFYLTRTGTSSKIQPHKNPSYGVEKTVMNTEKVTDISPDETVANEHVA